MKTKLFLVLLLLNISIISLSNGSDDKSKVKQEETQTVKTDKKLTIQEASEMALSNNREIKIAMVQLEQSHLKLDKAWKNAYFKVEYSASALYFLDDIEAMPGVTYDQNYSQSVKLTQPIYQGAIKPGIRLGKDGKTLSELALQSKKKDTVLKTVGAYIDVLNAENMLEVLKSSEDALNQNYKVQKAKYDLRMITKPEIMESERSLLEVQAQIIQTENQIDLTKRQLGNIIGIYDTRRIDLTPFYVEDDFTKKVDFEKDLKSLSLRNTEYLISELQRDMNKHLIDIEKAADKPTVGAFVSYGTTNKTKFSDITKERNYDTAIGVSVTWTLFDWNQNKRSVEIAQKEEEIAHIRTQSTLDDLKMGMRNTYYKLVSLEKELVTKRKAVDLATEVYNLEQERYAYRLITLRDLLSAETNLRKNKIDYIQSKLEYYNLVSQYGAFLD